MGQYHYVVNLDKRQFVHPHQMGAGLKLWEQLANHPGTGAALVVLLASGSNGNGSGDLRRNPVENTDGVQYPAIIGQWRGNRIAFVGDYDEETHYLVDGEMLSGATIYGLCSGGFYPEDDGTRKDTGWKDVSEAVCAVIEAELSGKFEGEGWRMFKFQDANDERAISMKPDMVFSVPRG